MVQAIRQDLTVEKDNVIEICSPVLKSGAHVEVIILFKENGKISKRSLQALIGSAKGAFDSPKQVDDFIRRERDTWE